MEARDEQSLNISSILDESAIEIGLLSKVRTVLILDLISCQGQELELAYPLLLHSPLWLTVPTYGVASETAVPVRRSVDVFPSVPGP